MHCGQLLCKSLVAFGALPNIECNDRCQQVKVLFAVTLEGPVDNSRNLCSVYLRCVLTHLNLRTILHESGACNAHMPAMYLAIHGANLTYRLQQDYLSASTSRHERSVVQRACHCRNRVCFVQSLTACCTRAGSSVTDCNRFIEWSCS